VIVMPAGVGRKRAPTAGPCSRKCAWPYNRGAAGRRSRKSTPRRIRCCRRSRGVRPIRPAPSRAARFSPRCPLWPLAPVMAEKAAALPRPESAGATNIACFHPIEIAARRPRMMQQSFTSRPPAQGGKTSSSNIPPAARPFTRCPAVSPRNSRCGRKRWGTGRRISGCGKSTLWPRGAANFAGRYRATWLFDGPRT